MFKASSTQGVGIFTNSKPVFRKDLFGNPTQIIDRDLFGNPKFEEKNSDKPAETSKIPS